MDKPIPTGSEVLVAELRDLVDTPFEASCCNSQFPILSLRRALDAAADMIEALTAAQQPVQEGGVEPWGYYTLRDGKEQFYNLRNSTNFQRMTDMVRRGLRTWAQCLPADAVLLYSAPPSAPVGDRREIDRVIRELRAYNPAADEYRGEHIHGVWAKELERALAQQPAQAAPGDARAIIEEFVQCAGVGRPPGKLIAQAQDWLAATPPGDDAAGGGHRG